MGELVGEQRVSLDGPWPVLLRPEDNIIADSERGGAFLSR
jgi:hypothetical protein